MSCCLRPWLSRASTIQTTPTLTRAQVLNCFPFSDLYAFSCDLLEAYFTQENLTERMKTWTAWT